MIALALDRDRIDHELSAVATEVERMEQLAQTALHVMKVGPRERDFATALLRHAKGARAAAAAWRQELKNR